MLIIDWDSEQYFTSWEEWFESFDYEQMIKRIRRRISPPCIYFSLSLNVNSN